jgi:hypothetical protein
MTKCRKGYGYVGSLGRCIKADKIIITKRITDYHNLNMDYWYWGVIVYDKNESMIDMVASTNLQKIKRWKNDRYPHVRIKWER